MSRRDIIVVGASAGGVPALCTLAAGLPADLPAAVFIVQHLSPYYPSHLPTILRQRGRLPVVHPTSGAAIVPGTIYVAPPDQHLLVCPGHVELSYGPKENHSRPSVDVLFRSAADTYGARVVGVVLTGTQSDGSLGLQAIAARGGVTIVQDPEEAAYAAMPQAALRATRGAHVLPLARIPALLAELAQDPGDTNATKRRDVMADPVDPPPLSQARDVVVQQTVQEQVQDGRTSAPSVYACPECGGILWQLSGGELPSFGCRVGHVWTAEELLGQLAEELERVLWTSLRLLDEQATLTRQVAEGLRREGRADLAGGVEAQAARDAAHAELIRAGLLQAAESPGAQVRAVLQAVAERTEQPAGARLRLGDP